MALNVVCLQIENTRLKWVFSAMGLSIG
jgi:hypothetical protein